MDRDIETLKRNYACSNARDVDAVLATLAADVVWANAMEGGLVRGREAVSKYWLRQLANISPHVEPLSFNEKVTLESRSRFLLSKGQPMFRPHKMGQRSVTPQT